MLGLCCCVWAFSSCGERGLLSIAVRSLHCSGFSCCGAQALGMWAQELQLPGSRAELGLSSCGHGLSGCRACGIFPDQGSNLCPLHWQSDSYPLCQRGSPRNVFFHSSGGQKSKDMLAGSCTFWKLWRRICSLFLLASGDMPWSMSWNFLAGGRITPNPATIFTLHSPLCAFFSLVSPSPQITQDEPLFPRTLNLFTSFACRR